MKERKKLNVFILLVCLADAKFLWFNYVSGKMTAASLFVFVSLLSFRLLFLFFFFCSLLAIAIKVNIRRVDSSVWQSRYQSETTIWCGYFFYWLCHCSMCECFELKWPFSNTKKQQQQQISNSNGNNNNINAQHMLRVSKFCIFITFVFQFNYVKFYNLYKLYMRNGWGCHCFSGIIFFSSSFCFFLLNA